MPMEDKSIQFYLMDRSCKSQAFRVVVVPPLLRRHKVQKVCRSESGRDELTTVVHLAPKTL